MKMPQASGVFLTLQWFVFMFANALMLPIVVGTLFQMQPEDIVGLIQRMFLVVGISSFLSARIGHRLPIIDGPAGVWLGVFILMSQLASDGGDRAASLRLLEGAMLFTGALVLIVSATGLLRRLMKVFTPLVTGVYLILLSVQLCGTLLKGMLSNGENGEAAGANIAIALGVFGLVFALSSWGKGWLKSYSLLIGVAVGWLTFALVNGPAAGVSQKSAFALPGLFAWGLPQLNAGIAVSSVIVAFIVISSLVASVHAMRGVLTDNGDAAGQEKAMAAGGMVSGISTMLTGLFSAIGLVPLSISAGFVQSTGQHKRMPFYAACVLLVAVSFMPPLFARLSLLPGQVAYAAMFASFAQILGIGMKALFAVKPDDRMLTIISMSLGIGTGVMFLPSDLFSAMPDALRYVLSNGLIVGMLVGLLLEQLWRSPGQAAGGPAKPATLPANS